MLNKPVYVMCESFKFVRLYPLNQQDLPDEFKVSRSGTWFAIALSSLSLMIRDKLFAFLHRSLNNAEINLTVIFECSPKDAGAACTTPWNVTVHFDKYPDKEILKCDSR